MFVAGDNTTTYSGIYTQSEVDITTDLNNLSFQLSSSNTKLANCFAGCAWRGSHQHNRLADQFSFDIEGELSQERIFSFSSYVGSESDVDDNFTLNFFGENGDFIAGTWQISVMDDNHPLDWSHRGKYSASFGAVANGVNLASSGPAEVVYSDNTSIFSPNVVTNLNTEYADLDRPYSYLTTGFEDQYSADDYYSYSVLSYKYKDHEVGFDDPEDFMLDGLELSLATSGEVSPEISFVQFKLDKDAILAFDKSRGDIVNLPSQTSNAFRKFVAEENNATILTGDISGIIITFTFTELGSSILHMNPIRQIILIGG